MPNYDCFAVFNDWQRHADFFIAAASNLVDFFSSVKKLLRFFYAVSCTKKPVVFVGKSRAQKIFVVP